MTENNDIIIELSHLEKAFGDHVVLRDINLSVRRGENGILKVNVSFFTVK